MFGFVVGAVTAVLLYRVYQRGGFRRLAFASGCGHRGPHGPRSRWMSRWLFRRLETSPGQEKVILAAMDEVHTEGNKLREEWHKARADLARAIRGNAFDTTAVAQAQTRQDETFRQLREKLSAELAKVHEALDERQRMTLAEIIEYGWRGGRARWDM